jgi:hypothetical protein
MGKEREANEERVASQRRDVCGLYISGDVVLVSTVSHSEDCLRSAVNKASLLFNNQFQPSTTCSPH